MSESDSNASDEDAYVLQSELSPADAAEARDELLSAFTAAVGSKKPLQLDISGETLTPCAIQLLVSAKRSAEVEGVSLVLSEGAESALASVNAD